MSTYVQLNETATAITRQRYQRISRWYDRMEAQSEKRYIPLRKKLWAQVQGQRVLEVGVGTGKNMPFYPPDARITAIDLTPGMLGLVMVGEVALITGVTKIG